MKGIAGTGSLALPFAFNQVLALPIDSPQVGIIACILLFVLVCGMMILATYQLIDINNEVNSMPPVVSNYSLHIQDAFPEIKTNNTYAELVFKVTGNIGYWIYYVCSLITLYGSNIGSMVVMTDFLSALPLGAPQYRRLIAQLILTVLCIVLCLLKDPK